MIDIIDLVKQFPGTARPAVDRLTLAIPDGEVCVLIGPSGCGKTTTMRIVNRMIEPDAGLVKVDGRDIMQSDPVTLRRSIGYVIQQVGLFPHWTIAENVATVPRLLGWDPARTNARIDELLAGAGIDVDRVKRDLASNAKTIDAILARNNDQATAFGFRGTPSFIIGKFRVPGALTMAQFDQAIADARKAAAKK